MNKLSPICLSLVAGLALFSCSTAPKTVEKKVELEQDARAALAKAKQQQPEFDGFCRRSIGYAVFPSVGKGAVGVGGAYGKGVLFEGDHVAGYCDMTQASVGLQLGGQKYTEILCFENEHALDKFKSDDLALDAQASAVAIDAGAGKNLEYRDGVAIVTTNEKGLMAEASIGGQKFTYEPR